MSKPRGRVRLVLTFLVLFLCLLGWGFWRYHERVLAKNLAAADRWVAANAELATVRAGATPADWPTRSFLPRKTLSAIVGALSGTEVVVPIGKLIGGHVSGYAHIRITKAKVKSEDSRVMARLRARLTYEPDRVTPEWASAAADILIDGALLPVNSAGPAPASTHFRVVPDEIQFAVGWSLFSAHARELTSNVLADEVMIHWGDALSFPIDPLSSSIEVERKLRSTSDQHFPGGGGTQLEISLERPDETLVLTTDKWLSTGSGLWLLGGLPIVVPPLPAGYIPTEAELRAKDQEVAKALRPFEKSGALVLLSVPKKILTDFVDKLLRPAPLEIKVSTSHTSGTLLHADLLNSIAVDVRPRGEGFGHGKIDISPQTSSWGPRKISVPLTATANAAVDLDLHLTTGIGPELTAPVTLSASGAVSDQLDVEFRKRTLPSNSAITLEATFACSKLKLVPNAPTPVPALNSPWLAFSPVGIEIDRNLAKRISPVVLVSELPNVIRLPVRKNPDGSKVARDPMRTLGLFQHPFLELHFRPSDALMEDAGLTVSADLVSVNARDEAESENEKEARRQLKRALAEAQEPLSCEANTQLSITGLGAKILNLNALWNAIKTALKDQVTVTKDVIKMARDIDPSKVPSDLGSLTNDVVNAGQSANEVWNKTHPFAPPLPTCNSQKVCKLVCPPHLPFTPTPPCNNVCKQVCK